MILYSKKSGIKRLLRFWVIVGYDCWAYQVISRSLSSCRVGPWHLACEMMWPWWYLWSGSSVIGVSKVCLLGLKRSARGALGSWGIRRWCVIFSCTGLSCCRIQYIVLSACMHSFIYFAHNLQNAIQTDKTSSPIAYWCNSRPLRFHTCTHQEHLVAIILASARPDESMLVMWYKCELLE